MDIGTAMSVAQTLFAALQCSQLNEACSIADYKSKLAELRATVVRIKAVLKDAEVKQELSEQERLFIEELKDAIYEADDLFDEFVTLAERNKLTKGIKVRVLSLFTKFGTAYNMTQGVKKIKSKLDAIANDSRFNLNIDHKPINNRRLETCSYVYDADIIGRELDLEKIVGMLLDSNVERNVSFLSIVGIGGLGKTALAQLVYNDARVTTAFSLKMWTCVADENQKILDVQGVLSKILASTTKEKNYQKFLGCTMDGLQSQLQEKLVGKKYLLVLDDVWTENLNSWDTLTKYLKGGQRGSWIVVTTRSRHTAGIIRGGLRHELQGLSKNDSWCLFEKVAFGSPHSIPHEDLVEIGQDIVEKCANVPLAIRVVGSLLYGQDKHKWLSIQEMGLAKVKESQSDIMPILMLSYHQLESPLKSCFGYCALFPKDSVMEKDTLIRLWMSQGYIPLDDLRTPEDLAEHYFSILLQRCLFQDVEKDEYGNIRSCKIHDLMHDVAQEVMGKEICTVKTMNGDMDKKVRHLSIIQSEFTNYVSSKTHLRSFLLFRESYRGVKKMGQISVDAIVANWKYLRALELSWSSMKSLPSSIGELIHLRYLDLSSNHDLEALPGSISKLYNLETLNLSRCTRLKQLPKDLRKLVMLRVLDLRECFSLRYMPKGMGMLTCLRTLNLFVLVQIDSIKKELFDGLEDLKALINLRGLLEMKVQYTKTCASDYKISSERREGGCLRNKEYLKHVVFYFNCYEHEEEEEEEEEGREEYDEAVMEELQPHSNLMSLEVRGYHGVRMPCWAREDNLSTFFPNLVEIRFKDFKKLQYLGHLRLPRLKVLQFFDCPNITAAILECPSLEYLELYDFNERLKIVPTVGGSSYDIGPKLKEVTINNVAWLNSLPVDSFQGLEKLYIEFDRRVKNLGEIREVFRSCSSSLKYLRIECCRNLKSVICGGLEHLSALEELLIYTCPILSEAGAEGEYPFYQSLRSLSLDDLSQLVELPNWIQYLTGLQSLKINS